MNSDIEMWVERVAKALYLRDHPNSVWRLSTFVTKQAYRDEARQIIFNEGDDE